MLQLFFIRINLIILIDKWAGESIQNIFQKYLTNSLLISINNFFWDLFMLFIMKNEEDFMRFLFKENMFLTSFDQLY